MKLLLDMIQNVKYNWNICGDLKVIALCLACSLAIQSFVACCVSGIVGTEKNHYIKNSGLNENVYSRMENVLHTPLMKSEKVLFTSVAHQT
jgi:hypothetical protein